MGFTRSTTNTSVHQGMPDYPSSEGYTTSQLKAAFDAPAEGLQTDVNGLMTELESVASSGYLGADVITESDDSAPNIQAKLEKIYSDMQGIALGDIPDNSVTEAKLSSTYTGSVAKKDGTLQTGLNAEQLGGKTLSYILGEIAKVTYDTGTFTVDHSTSKTVTLGFQPKAFMFVENTGSGYTTGDPKPFLGIVIGSKKFTVYRGGDVGITDVNLTSSGITMTGFSANYTRTYNYIAWR